MGRHKKVGRNRKISVQQYKHNQNEVSKKWKKEHTTALTIRFLNDKDNDIIEHLKTLTIPKTDYLKTLIRNDIKKKQG